MNEPGRPLRPQGRPVPTVSLHALTYVVPLLAVGPADDGCGFGYSAIFDDEAAYEVRSDDSPELAAMVHAWRRGEDRRPRRFDRMRRLLSPNHSPTVIAPRAMSGRPSSIESALPTDLGLSHPQPIPEPMPMSGYLLDRIPVTPV